MVIKLNIPTVVENEEDFINTVVSERTREPNKTFFREYKARWVNRVNEFIEQNANPETITNSDVTSYKKKFINLYESPRDNSVQKPILEELRNRKLNICPSCGEDGTPNTLDHYLPKDKYPEFSILTKNLFPMCDICQGEKLTKDLDEDNNRIFVNPYYDNFLNCQLLKLEIDGPFNSPENFNLAVNDNLDDEDYNLVSRHIDKLKIIERYSSYFTDQYFRTLKLVKEMRVNQLDIVANLNMFKFNAQMKSINSWEHIFYSGIIDNDNLIEYLCEGEIPENI